MALTYSYTVAPDAIPPPAFYSTDFSTSDSGWVKGLTDGGNWTDGSITGGLYVNTQDNVGNFDDSIMHRTGTWSPDHYCQSTVFKGTTHDEHEVEHLLRFLITSGNARGYEVLWAHDGAYGPQLVRWNGPRDDFTPLVDFALGLALNNGDVVYTSIVGNIVTLKVNGVTKGTADITTGVGAALVHSTGKPGAGNYRGHAGNADQYAWTNFTAGDL